MKRSILITDDEQAIRESLYLFLKGEGYDCKCAADGNEAVQMACSNRFDLIILDLHMPHSHGLEVLKQIKDCSPEAAVLILTSYYELEQAAEALLLGATKMLLKPIDFEELLDVIEGLVETK